MPYCEAFCTPPVPTAFRHRPVASRAPRCSISSTPTKTILSWNVNGLRSLAQTDPHALTTLLETYDPQIVCLQETKLQERHEPLFFDMLPRFEYFVFHSSTSRLSYSGTVTYSRPQIRVCQRKIDHYIGDEEGRMVMIEYPCLFLINVHNISSGSSLRRLKARLSWDQALRKHIRHMRGRGKPVMVVGDLNVAREPLDVYDENAVQHLAGYSDLERISFEDTLETCGMVDIFRKFNPQQRAFTYWDTTTGARERNDGWRVDYVLVSDDMIPAVKSVNILDHVRGSDHCPMIIELTDGIL